MRKLVYYVGVTLDGYIAGPDGQYDFFPTNDDLLAWIHADYPEFVPTPARGMAGIADAPNRHCDTLVMGRGTYDPGVAMGITSPYAHLRQYVVSRSLGPVDAPDLEVVDADPLGLVRRLKKEEGLDIWLCGGGDLAGQLFGEIDQLILKSYPVIAGAGVPLVAGGFDPTRFRPTRRQEFGDVIVSWFDRV
ncbi:dihydrofolate reductase family protein [Nocardia takedensis]|uniref:dihydrofolate reductase family protein n=1 Tax=Nocardia takedensis TaxID=259390 RepID=UPI000592C10D|nr:dihydrofolate reductase family protein [Nocardia takedensis]